MIDLKDLFIRLYKARYIETLWNAEKKEHQEKGWTLKSGLRVPWFFNMRPIGDEPELFYVICQLLSELILDEGKPDLLVGVEMAGVPLVGGISAIMRYEFQQNQRIAYTRPLPTKLRTPLEVLEFFQKIERDSLKLSDYGQKDMVEGRMRDGDSVAILDDMATNLGSKIMARLIVLKEAAWRGVQVSCDHIFYFMDRGDDGTNIKTGLDFVNEPEFGLCPASLQVNFVMSFNRFLPCLEGVMAPAEFTAIMEHQKDTSRFHKDETWRNEIIARANEDWG